MIRYFESYKNEIAYDLRINKEVSLSPTQRIKGLIANIAGKSDIFVDPSTGDITIDQIRAFTCQENYNKNDAIFAVDMIGKFADVAQNNYPAIAELTKEKAKILNTALDMDTITQQQICDICRDIAVKYGACHNLQPEIYPKYGIVTRHETAYDFTNKGIMSEIEMENSHIHSFAENPSIVKEYDRKVMDAQYKLEKNSLKYDYDEIETNKFAKSIKAISDKIPGVELRYKPNNTVNIYTEDIDFNLSVQPNNANVFLLLAKEIKDADIAHTDTIYCIEKELNREHGYRYTREQCSIIEPSVQISRQQYFAQQNNIENQR